MHKSSEKNASLLVLEFWMDLDEIYFLASDTTLYHCDSVEWCPSKDFSQFFACGTYQLDEEASVQDDGQIRSGNVTLYRLDSSDRDSSFGVSAVDCVPTSGILDMKWSPSPLSDKVVLALVCSDGKVLLKYVEENEGRVCLAHLTDYDTAAHEDKMLLSVDWSNQNANAAAMITSDTKGHLSYMEVRESEMSLVNSWKAHNFESWVTAFNYTDENIVYSGGDDCYFKVWDLRSLVSPIYLKKNHSMGVTAITKSKLNENFLLTGSYDENIFLWDTRQMKSPLSERNVGGGVWRLKWHPTNPRYFLSAAMHNGFHVLSICNETLKLELSYTQHKSLAYGVDWSYLSSEWTNNDRNNKLLTDLDKENIRDVVASCSFYDNLLHIWGIKCS